MEGFCFHSLHYQLSDYVYEVLNGKNFSALDFGWTIFYIKLADRLRLDADASAGLRQFLQVLGHKSCLLHFSKMKVYAEIIS